jgi:Tfp pilus assembly protein PilZ
VGETIELSIELPNSSHITARGTVRWVRAMRGTEVSPGLGIEFMDLQTHGALSHP